MHQTPAHAGLKRHVRTPRSYVFPHLWRTHLWCRISVPRPQLEGADGLNGQSGKGQLTTLAKAICRDFSQHDKAEEDKILEWQKQNEFESKIIKGTRKYLVVMVDYDLHVRENKADASQFVPDVF